MTEKPMDQPVHTPKTAEDLEAEEMVREDRMRYPLPGLDKELVREHKEAGVSMFGGYLPDPNYLVEICPEGKEYLYKDGRRIRELRPEENRGPEVPARRPLTLEAAKRIIRLDKGRANNELEGFEMPERDFQRMCELAREADSDEEFERLAMDEFVFNDLDFKETPS